MTSERLSVARNGGVWYLCNFDEEEIRKHIVNDRFLDLGDEFGIRPAMLIDINILDKLLQRTGRS